MLADFEIVRLSNYMNKNQLAGENLYILKNGVLPLFRRSLSILVTIVDSYSIYLDQLVQIVRNVNKVPTIYNNTRGKVPLFVFDAVFYRTDPLL